MKKSKAEDIIVCPICKGKGCRRCNELGKLKIKNENIL